MANPWTKKNPLLSLALSGANAWASAARGLWAAEGGRTRTAALKGAAAFWAGGRTPKARKRKQG